MFIIINSRIILIAAVLFGSYSVSKSADITTQELMNRCISLFLSSKEEGRDLRYKGTEQGFCMGYFTSIFYSVNVAKSNNKSLFCFPKEFNEYKLAHSFIDYSADRPEIGELPSTNSVMVMLHKKYTCFR